MGRFFLFTIVLILTSCNQDKTMDIDMSDEDVVAILQDLHVANSIVLKYSTYDRDSVSQILRSQIAEIHNISVEGIDYVMEQIQLSPTKYLTLEKKAVENLKSMKDSLKLSLAVQPEK